MARNFFPFLLIPFFVWMMISCGAQKKTAEISSPYPKDLKWMRHSIEYDLICIEVYRNAWEAVKTRVAEIEEPWTIVMDVDETVLSNSRYQEVLWEKQENYPYYWDTWIREMKCPPVPGAKAFLDSLRTLGPNANVVFITNRDAATDSATQQNLISTNMWQDGDLVMGRKNRQDTKEVRRGEVTTGTGRSKAHPPRRIIALFGDQLGDFTEYEYNSLQDLKNSYLDQPQFGRQNFVLPNPMYGYWERDYQ